MPRNVFNPQQGRVADAFQETFAKALRMDERRDCSSLA